MPAKRGISVSARPEFLAAFTELVRRIQASLSELPRRSLPVEMYVAGGAAIHFYTGARVTHDIDAAFSRRILLPAGLEVSYRADDGAAALLYFDHQYNDTLALMHEDARDDSLPLALTGIDPAMLKVRLLSPLDLAISKVSRFSEQDRADIALLAMSRLIGAREFHRRAEQAAQAYVGDLERVRNSIRMTVNIIESARRKAKRD